MCQLEGVKIENEKKYQICLWNYKTWVKIYKIEMIWQGYL